LANHAAYTGQGNLRQAGAHHDRIGRAHKVWRGIDQSAIQIKGDRQPIYSAHVPSSFGFLVLWFPQTLPRKVFLFSLWPVCLFDG